MSYCNYGYCLLGEVARRVADQSLGTFARERIFGTLGMRDTSYGLPDDRRIRFVRRGPNAPAPLMDDHTLVRHFGAAGGVFSTAPDLAIYGTMILNRGTYWETRILSRAAVSEMTRNQTPGVPASYDGEVFPESSWGLGWDVHGTKRGLRAASLLSPNAISNGGTGGTYFWIDRDFDLVGAYLSVNRIGPNEGSPFWRADLFANAATAAIDEP
jgi:serine-type D-Ala-D-Ala carboxypeptidase